MQGFKKLRKAARLANALMCVFFAVFGLITIHSVVHVVLVVKAQSADPTIRLLPEFGLHGLSSLVTAVGFMMLFVMAVLLLREETPFSRENVARLKWVAGCLPGRLGLPCFQNG